jgi:hypothetical protein
MKASHTDRQKRQLGRDGLFMGVGSEGEADQVAGNVFCYLGDTKLQRRGE